MHAVCDRVCQCPLVVPRHNHIHRCVSGRPIKELLPTSHTHPRAFTHTNTRQVRHREGYEEGLSTSHKTNSALAFIASDAPVEMLGQVRRERVVFLYPPHGSLVLRAGYLESFTLSGSSNVCAFNQ